MSVGREEPRPVALATHCNEWVELHTSEWAELVVVVVMSQYARQLCVCTCV